MTTDKVFKTEKNQNSLFRPGDLVLILILFFCALCAFAFVRLQVKEGHMVCIRIDGQIYGEYPLDEDREIILGNSASDIAKDDIPGTDPSADAASGSDIAGDDTSGTDISGSDITGDDTSGTDPSADAASDTSAEGTWHNILVIKDGRADMTDADCPDRICVNHRPVSQEGETIVCLPHKVVVEVK